MKQRVAIIIPAYNEASAVANVVRDVAAVFKKTRYHADIIVIDDGSHDTTAEEATRAGAHVIHHILNSGSGSATSTGIFYARYSDYDIAVTIDADGQHAAQDALEGVMRLKDSGADLLIGSRVMKPTSDMSLLKRIGNRGLSLVTYLLFGINIRDSQSGLRVFSRTAIDELEWKASGYEFCSEMLWRAKQKHLRVSEYPITTIYTEYSRTKGQSNWNGYNIVKLLLRQRVMEFFE